MITLNVSPKELLDLLKKNVKLPPFLQEMTCKYNVFFFTIPRQGQEGVPLDVDFRFSAGRFHFRGNSGPLDGIAELTFTVHDILDILEAGQNGIPDFLKTLSFDEDKDQFSVELNAGAAAEGTPPLFSGPLQLAARLTLPPTDILCLELEPDNLPA